MIFNILITLISLILENIFNLYLNEFKYFTPLFTILSLIFVYPYFKNSKKDFFLFSFILGLVYDLFFTNFYVLNSILFLIISIVIYYILNKKDYSLRYIIVTCIVSILLYNLLLFLILNFFNYVNYSLLDFSYILKYFIIGNILYIVILYLILKNTYFKNKI